MFKFKQLFFFTLLASAIMLTSCKKEEKEEPVTNNPSNAGEAAVSALIDGEVWQSSPDGPHSPVGAVGMQNTNLNINIQAYGSDGSYMSLNVVSTSGIEENTAYSAESGFFQASYREDYLNSDGYSTVIEGATGTITFTNISSGNISGTFSYMALKPLGGSISADNGSFNIDL